MKFMLIPLNWSLVFNPTLISRPAILRCARLQLPFHRVCCLWMMMEIVVQYIWRRCTTGDTYSKGIWPGKAPPFCTEGPPQGNISHLKEARKEGVAARDGISLSSLIRRRAAGSLPFKKAPSKHFWREGEGGVKVAPIGDQKI